MRTIREVWKTNLNRLIGGRSLKEVSAGAGVPYRSLQNMLDGAVSYEENMQKLAAYFGIPETHLFVDFEEFGPKRPMNPHQALEVLANAIDTGKHIELEQALAKIAKLEAKLAAIEDADRAIEEEERFDKRPKRK